MIYVQRYKQAEFERVAEEALEAQRRVDKDDVDAGVFCLDWGLSQIKKVAALNTAADVYRWEARKRILSNEPSYTEQCRQLREVDALKDDEIPGWYVDYLEAEFDTDKWAGFPIFPPRNVDELTTLAQQTILNSKEAR